MQTATIDPLDVDIRLAVGVPVKDRPINMLCPKHIHYARVGHEDETGSLMVYRGNLHCLGCSFHVTRRYASLAFLLGLWDGLGKEDCERVRTIVREMRGQLSSFINRAGEAQGEGIVPPIDPYLADTFHQYLMCCEKDRLVDELQIRRGLTLGTIKRYKLGHTGSHFSIPVFDLSNALTTIRYRADETRTDTHAGDYRKYEGTRGRNSALLFPLQVLRGLSAIEELWLTEGEMDAISSNQAGNVTLTSINGASQVERVPEMLRGVLPDLRVGKWIVATDQDGAGNRAAEQVMSILSEWGELAVRAKWDDAKDLNEFYAHGGAGWRVRYE